MIIDEIILYVRNHDLGLPPIYDFLVDAIEPNNLSKYYFNVINYSEKITPYSSVYVYEIDFDRIRFHLRLTKVGQAHLLAEIFYDNFTDKKTVTYNLELISFCGDNKLKLICSGWFLDNICPKEFLRKRKLEKLNLLG